MSRKKRLLRIGCISLAILAFVGYFAFSTFFFPPLEGRFKPDIAGLIPRGVDVYLARADLDSTFEKFPDLAIAEEASKHPAVKAFFESPTWQEFESENSIEQLLADVRTELGKLPLGMDLLDVAGGEDLALAANFAGSSIEDTEWAVYARASFWGKLAASAVKHPGLIGLSKQGMDAVTSDGLTTISGGDLDKPIHITRINDVIVAGSSLSLVQDAGKLEAAGSQDSLLLAAPYGDSILSLDRATNQRDFEIQFDVRKMRETWGLTKDWPDPKSERFTPAFTARLLPVGAVRRVLGVLDFDQGLSIDLSGEFSSELMTASQERIYREKGFDHDEVMNVASFVRDDATIFVYIRGPIGTILQMVLDSLEPAARENLTSVVQEIGYDSIGEVIKVLDESLVDRIAFIARPNDWGYEGDMVPDEVTGEKVYGGPPLDGTENEVFAWAAIGWMSDEAELNRLKERIAIAGPRIGIHGKSPQDSGYFFKPIGGGLSVTEFWSPFVKGTGHIAQLYYGENLIISNRYAMVDELVANRVQQGSSAPLLSNRTDFQLMVQDSLDSANVLFWTNPRSGIDRIETQAKSSAEQRLKNSIDYTSKRRQVERQVSQETFGGRARSRLNADEAIRLDEIVDAKLREYRDEIVDQNLPREMEAAERLSTYLESISASLSMIRLSPKEFQISVRLVTPLETSD